MRGDIYHIDGKYMYKNENAADTGTGSFALKAGETVWLSEYIKNYRATAYIKPVHMQALIDVLSGSVDMNVCMLRSNGTPGDRSGFNSEPAFGKYRRDRTQKGIADTLPLVTAELEYTIDDSTVAGTALPVTVRNQYVPDGNTVTTWTTHLNPQDDIWSKTITAENDMLTYKYKDDSKLSFYGEDVPESERDNVWVFNPFHSDTNQYVPQSGVLQSQYSPNYPLSPEKDNQGYACSMGNYGVWTTYHFTIINNGAHDRWLEYTPKTSSNILVYSDTEPFDVFEMTDKKTYCKGMNETGVEDIMASELLPAGKTTDVYISVNLPVNTFGGVMNTFCIMDANNFHPKEAEPFETIPGNDYPLLSEIDTPGENTLKTLDGNLSNYELIGDPASGYIARPCAWDARPYLCYNIWDFTEVIYSLDKNYNIIGTYKFPSPPTEGGFDGEKHYIKTVQHGIYESSDGGVSWSKSAQTAIPDRAVVALAGYTPTEIILDGTKSTVLPNSVSDALGKYISQLELHSDGDDDEGGTAELILERDGAKLTLDGGVWHTHRKTYTPLNFIGADFNEKLRAIVLLCESGCSDWSIGYMTEALLEDVIDSYFWAEDLRGYGFDVVWDAEALTLSITPNDSMPRTVLAENEINIKKADIPVHQKLYDVYSTDIKTYLNGMEINACNIDGETLVKFVDLSAVGYVNYNDTDCLASLDVIKYCLDKEYDSAENKTEIAIADGVTYIGQQKDGKPNGVGKMYDKSQKYGFPGTINDITTTAFYTNGAIDGMYTTEGTYQYTTISERIKKRNLVIQKSTMGY